MLESHSGNCSGFVIRRFILREFESHLQHQSSSKVLFRSRGTGKLSRLLICRSSTVGSKPTSGAKFVPR